MRKDLVIRIKRRSQPEWLIWVLVILPFLFGTLNELLRLPNAVHYVLDIAWLGLLLFLVRFNQLIQKKGTWFMIWIGVFAMYTLFAYLAQYQSILYYLWGIRNSFRMYVLFLAVTTFLKVTDGETLLNFFNRLFWLNVAVSLVQYFVFGYLGDYLGGIFGTEKGGNAYTNLFFVIVLTHSLIRYLEKQESIRDCALKCIAALMISAMAEIKFFFVELILIISMAVLVTNFTWRKLLMIVGGMLCIIAGAIVLGQIFPSSAGFLNLQRMISIVASNKGYTSSGDLNRLTAIPRINALWLKSGWDQLTGLGLGNCDTSGFAFLNTPFYKKYGYMHYSWISYAQMYLETGWIGLSFYIGFFVLIYLQAGKVQRSASDIRGTYAAMVRILAPMCVLISIYDSSLRTEAAYMMYFVLALPFVKADKRLH